MSVVAYIALVLRTVKIRNAEQVKLKCFIVSPTPFDTIIGLEAIRKHYSLAKFSANFGLASTDITLALTYFCFFHHTVKHVGNHFAYLLDKPPPCIAQSDFVFDLMESVIDNHTIVTDGAVPPKQLIRHIKRNNLHENTKLSKRLNISSDHTNVL